jgi:hypothetical protein
MREKEKDQLYHAWSGMLLNLRRFRDLQRNEIGRPSAYDDNSFYMGRIVGRIEGIRESMEYLHQEFPDIIPETERGN